MNLVQGVDHVGTESFFVSVDLLIHSEQYANKSMAVLIKRTFLNCDQVSSRFTEYSGKLTFYTLCSSKVRY